MLPQTIHPLEQRWVDAHTDFDDRPIYEWAAEHVTLSKPLTKQGLFSVAESRHFIGPFDAFKDDRTRELNIIKPLRGGGSLIGDICLVWATSNDCGPWMDVFQKDEVAASHFYSRPLKMLRLCEQTNHLLPADDRECCPPEIILQNGYSIYVNGPAITNLQTKGIRYMRLDEPYLYRAGTILEADGRLGDYKKLAMSKLLCISQAGPDSGSLDDHEWYAHTQKAETNEWSVQCASCGKHCVLDFFGNRPDGTRWGAIWDHHKLPNGDWHVGRCAPTARFECEHCGHGHISNPRVRSDWNRTGQYVLIGEPNLTKRNFHYPAMVDTDLCEMVAASLEAENAARRGITKPKLQFYQKQLAVFMDETKLLRISQRFSRLVYDIKSDWPEEYRRYMSIDVQAGNLCWYTVRAWSLDGHSRRLTFGQAVGFAELEKIREEYKVEPNHTTIDSAYQPKGESGVFAACCRYGWRAVIGDSRDHFLHPRKKGPPVFRSYAVPTMGDPETGSSNVSITRQADYATVIRFSKPTFNSRVQGLIDTGFWQEPPSDDSELEKQYAEQMNGRVRREEFHKKTGQRRTFWRETKNDHARDLANQQCLLATLDDILPDTLDSILSDKKAEAA